jgi:hypothetical protein
MADGPSSTILSWNVTNWVTVVLMALIFFSVLAFAQAWYAKRQGGDS